MLITSTSTIEGKTIAEYKNMVTICEYVSVGTIRAGAIAKDIPDAIGRCKIKMQTSASGADAVIGTNVAISPLGTVQGVVVTVTGTPVVFAK